ncbi:aminotransferase [Chaetoceros tenuissimus]|uniref:Aminotransferase n=1 Tax=Chaetoceros tenuissimus TaxID=426638 RepID=A0AAD3CKI1_9STRA|nr:aminotransferase [Chaetoceros tenuissimus]
MTAQFLVKKQAPRQKAKDQFPKAIPSSKGDVRAKLLARSASSDVSTASSSTSKDSVELIRSNVIGQRCRISSPFHREHEIVYADYTASGRCLQFVEDYMTKVVAPTYANTHTEASATGAQTTHLREEARNIIHEALNAPKEEYAVLFNGSGSTAAIEKIFAVLGFSIPEYAEKKWDLSENIPEQEKPVVFISSYEHHSNELMWRESPAVRCVVIQEGVDGTPDLNHLRNKLKKYASQNSPMIGSFSAGSNVTGIRTPVKSVAKLLHEYGAYAFFDYAGVGAYVSIDMAGKMGTSEDDSIDAAFLSPHKFIGGPGASGVLVARRNLFKKAFDVETQLASSPAGGTVDLVNKEHAQYSREIEHREDAGTPNILGDIRAGLAFRVKEMVGCDTIEKLENIHCSLALNAWRSNKAIALMGANHVSYHFATRRVSIFSFNILSPIELDIRPKSPSNASTEVYNDTNLGRLFAEPLNKIANMGTVDSDNLYVPLHYNFVIALLNDVYGIQARGGCSCAGPLAWDLFDFEGKLDDSLMSCFNVSSFKPGWARVNLNYFISHHEATFICEAINQISHYGWLLLPLYVHDLESGTFVHHSLINDEGQVVKSKKVESSSLYDLTFESFMQGSKSKSKASFPKPKEVSDERPRSSYKKLLRDAKKIYKEEALRRTSRKVRNFTKESLTYIEDKKMSDNIWWLLPTAVEEYLMKRKKN